jgi:hypothetical protein
MNFEMGRRHTSDCAPFTNPPTFEVEQEEVPRKVDKACSVIRSSGPEIWFRKYEIVIREQQRAEIVGVSGEHFSCHHAKVTVIKWNGLAKHCNLVARSRAIAWHPRTC